VLLLDRARHKNVMIVHLSTERRFITVFTVKAKDLRDLHAGETVHVTAVTRRSQK
jgi:hypothetical protein